MNTAMCSRCGKNIAVVFITKLENNEMKNEGLCLKCARELHIKPIDQIMERFGISDEDIDGIAGEAMNYLSGIEDLNVPEGNESDDDEERKTTTLPFFGKLFGAKQQSSESQDSQNNEKKAETPNPGKGTPSASKQPKHKFLDTYCIDLTGRASEGKLDNMIGREEELERVIQILNRRQKNNPCLIGEPGVGKTAIAEGLAQRIVMGNVPMKLKNKQVYLLDLTALVAGTQFRGQFESRMKGLVEDIRRHGNAILVIDEIHNIVGAGDAEGGSMNAANILKPALSRGEIQVIGATTFTEYRKHIEKDSALERRFQPVTVNEPSIEDSIKIIEGIAHYYEDYHGVVIPPEICRAAVVMSERYITDRFLPDKAIDLIDEACSDVNLRDPDINRMAAAAKDLNDIRFEREALMSAPVPEDEGDVQELLDKRYARIAELRSKEIKLETELKELESHGKPKLSKDNLARIIELWTKIPAASVNEGELERLSGLNDRLKKHIIGQDEAVDAVCSAIKRNRVGLKIKQKPVSFIFVGGTGVGKTELVKRLAEDMFDSPESLIRLDMSEFMEKFAVSRIIGSPPGYVGYDEAGQLTEKIRRKPYSVVLFDEIEKAHPDVMNILLQILDDGRITDAQGRVVNFENTIIIMTTNAGSSNKSGNVGFGGTLSDMTRERSLKALGEFLRPEFMNRVDEIICFNQLSEENFAAIAGLMLQELKEAAGVRNLEITYDEKVLDYLVKKGYSVTYGARNLRRLIQKEIEDPAAEELIRFSTEHSGKEASRISITADEEKLSVAVC